MSDLLKELWDEVKDFGETEKELVIQAICDAANALGPVVRSAAKTAITAAAQNMVGATGPEKFVAAQQATISTLEGEGIRVGIDVGIDFINRTIEAVYVLLAKVWDSVVDACKSNPGPDGVPGAFEYAPK